MKRITAILSILILIIMHSISYASAKPTGLLILGDSISTGYGLDGYVKGNENREIASFSNLLSRSLGCFNDNNYKNLASDGKTTDELLEAIKASPSTYSEYQYISVTIGGNDLLDTILPSLMTTLDDFSAEDIYGGKIIGKIQNFNGELSKQIDMTINHASKNIDETLKLLRQYNPDSFIVIQTVYNPFDGRDNKLFSYINERIINPSINKLNDSIKESAKKYEVYVADINSVFKGNEDKYTNINKFDIHPSSKGHLKILDIIQKSVNQYQSKK